MPGHHKGMEERVRGNRLVDKAAKEVVSDSTAKAMIALVPLELPPTPHYSQEDK